LSLGVLVEGETEEEESRIDCCEDELAGTLIGEKAVAEVLFVGAVVGAAALAEA